MTLYVKTIVKKSNISGKGLYAKENIPCGKIIGNLAENIRITSESDYAKEIKNGNTLMKKTAIRWVGKYFLYKDRIDNEEYFNHSCNPNVLYHCGICFALSDIKKGEELLIDYRFFLGKGVEIFTDSTNKKKIDGYSSREALLKSTIQLKKILEKTEVDDNLE